MLKFNGRRSSGPSFILGMGLIMVLVLTACGDQNPSVASQGGVVAGVQASSGGTSQGQSSSTAKATPKPGATTAKVATTGVLHICSLLSKDEVAASLGGTADVVDAASDTLGEYGQANCNYTNSTGGLTVQLSLTGESKADFEKGFSNSNPQPVPDLGEAAFFQGGQLSTLKGKVVVLIFLVNPSNGSETLNKATILTQKILAALEKTNHANDLISTVPVGNSKQVTTADIPVYPGSVQVKDDTASGTLIATFTSTDSFTSIVSWYKKIIADKSWTGSAAFEPEADYTILSAGKATADTSSRLLISIKGPKKADRDVGLDDKGNPIVLNPNSTLIVMTLSGKQ